MNPEIRQCQNCKSQFEILDEDLSFYRKVQVPPPTACPECRLIRRMAFRNEKSFFKALCGLCGSSVISMHNPKNGAVIYCHKCWWGDGWDGVTYGKSYDFNRPFFEQWYELMQVVPRLALEGVQNHNSPYTNYTWYSKNVYLSSSVIYAENVMYSHLAWYSTDVLDCGGAYHSQLVYELIECHNCSGVRFAINCRECVDSAFLYDCRNCTDCFMSKNLRNKSFVFRGVQLTREEYSLEISKINFGSAMEIQKLRQEFEDLRRSALHRFTNTSKVQNVIGDILVNSKACYHCFRGSNLENVRYTTQATEIKDSMDLFGAGDKAELLYEGVNVGLKDSLILFSKDSFEGLSDVRYCDYCRSSCANLFGCVGLRNKQYCILNKQYSREEYEQLVPQIIKHMADMPFLDQKGRVYKYGEFIPPEFSPFAYNETVAQEYFPISEGQAREQGYKWLGREARDYKIDLSYQDLPDSISEVSDSIVKQSIGCEHEGRCADPCATAFIITPEELAFYRRMNLPLPRLCPNCRHFNRVRQHNPLRLWHRPCACGAVKSEKLQVVSGYQNTATHTHGDKSCPNEFETSYAPEKSEIVYCEACYNAEVV